LWLVRERHRSAGGTGPGRDISLPPQEKGLLLDGELCCNAVQQYFAALQRRDGEGDQSQCGPSADCFGSLNIVPGFAGEDAMLELAPDDETEPRVLTEGPYDSTHV
jgi:hypothetical protein